VSKPTAASTQTSSPPPPSAKPAPAGPIKVAVQNAKPAKPLNNEEIRTRSIANLQKLGQALVAHAQRTGALPANLRDEHGAPLLSWRVALLPDLGYGELYRQFRLNESWDSPHNSELLPQIPPELQSPERFDRKTNYLGLAGSGQAFGLPRGAVPSSMEDGAENTVVVVEADDGRAVHWSAPEDYYAAADSPRESLGTLRTDGIFAILGDGQVVRVGPELPDHLLLALFTPDGGEQVAAAELLQPPTEEPAKIAAATPAETLLSTTSAPGEGPAPAISAIPPAGALPGTGRLPGSSSKSPTTGGQIAIPPEDELAKARELFRDLFGKQYASARTWQEKSQFAQLLLTEAGKVEANPAQYYELLRIAQGVAASGGDVPTGLKAADLLTAHFQVDALALRLKLLDDLSKSPRRTESAEALRKESLQLLLDAFDSDNFDVALPAYERLVEFTRLKGDRAEMSRLTQRKQPLEAAKQAYQAACAAAETLKANSDDAAAAETLGKYLCFVKNDWEAGLPHLVRAAEIKLRVVATIDLQPGRSPQDTLSLADQYWEMAGDYKQPFTRGLHLRAALCYQTARNTLPDGLEKLKAQKRIDEAGEIYGKEVVARALAPPAAVPKTVTMD
jgi:hypothetical protein